MIVYQLRWRCARVPFLRRETSRSQFLAKLLKEFRSDEYLALFSLRSCASKRLSSKATWCKCWSRLNSASFSSRFSVRLQYFRFLSMTVVMCSLMSRKHVFLSLFDWNKKIQRSIKGRHLLNKILKNMLSNKLLSTLIS